MLNVYDGMPYSNLTPQCQKLLDHFHIKGSISNCESQTVYKMRALPRRIADLKAVGYIFDSSWEIDPTLQRYKKYFLTGWKNPATNQVEMIL